jgi:pimeloyl-ACP methyl ester carboxylesterase
MGTDFPAVRHIRTNGIELAIHEAGEGTPVLLLHGFPELAYSWRHQIRPIANAGFRVIAPNQRGYDGSSAPADSQAYNVKTLVADLTGVLDALELERAVFLGHDWGSMPAWYAGVYASDRVLGIGSLCTPYFTPGEADHVEASRELRGPNNYIVTFQEPGVGEALLERDVAATFRALLRGRGVTMEEFEASPPDVREIPAGVFVGDPQLFGAPIVTTEELAVYVETFRKTGFTGPLNWYRALHQNWEEALGHEFVINKPALMVSGADDWFFARGATDHMGELLPHLEKHVIPEAGHWLQQEKPDQVSALIISWLRRNFA